MVPPEEVAAFPDTNIFLHYRPIAELDWRSMTQGHPVRIQIAPVVTRELEERKTLHPIKRIRNRADMALRMLHNFLKEGLTCKIGDDVWLDFLDHEPSQEFAISKRLNPQLKDDSLVASVLDFRESHAGTKALLVTADLPLIVKALPYQIVTVKPPEEQRLPDEPDAAEQKIRKLEGQLRLYKSRVPDLAAHFDDGKDYRTFQIFLQLPNTEQEIATSLKAIKEKYPLSQPEPQLHPPGLEMSNVFSEQIMESIKNVAASMQGFESYDTRLKRWYQRYESYLREDAAFKDRERRTITLNLTLTNHGTCPAEDIHLRFHFPDGFDVYDEESQPEPPEEPDLPSSSYASGLLIPSIIRAEMPLPKFDNPNAPKIRKTNSYDVTFHRDRLKHDFVYRCRPLYLGFDSFAGAQSFSFSYNIHAGNAPLSQEGELHVIIDKRTSEG